MTMPDMPPHTLPPIARAGGARLPESGGRGFYIGREGVRAEWQDGPKTPARLNRITAMRLGRRWQSRHSARVSAGALPPPRRGTEGFARFARFPRPPRGPLQVLRRPDDRAPHVGDRAVVVAQAFGRLLEVAADDVGELVELDVQVGIERVDVVHRDLPARHVPLVGAHALVVRGDVVVG